jgi:hypothetical protein
MEILLITAAVLTILVISILVGTGGRPVKFFTAFGDTLRVIGQNKAPIFYVLLAIVVSLGFVYLIFIFPHATAGIEQPIAFSHRVHAGHKAIDCRFCHPYVKRSTYPGVPPVEKCLFCHDHIIANHPEIKKEHEYFDTNTPTPWRKVNYVPEHVFFNHQRHIRKEIDCEACHGRVQAMDRVIGRDFKMGFCLECHRDRNANIGCWLACHN